MLVRLSLFVTVAPRSVQYGTALFRARVVWRAGSMCFGALPVPLCGVRALSAIMYKNVLRVYLYLLCGCRSPCCFILKYNHFRQNLKYHCVSETQRQLHEVVDTRYTQRGESPHRAQSVPTRSRVYEGTMKNSHVLGLVEATRETPRHYSYTEVLRGCPHASRLSDHLSDQQPFRTAFTPQTRESQRDDLVGFEVRDVDLVAVDNDRTDVTITQLEGNGL